MRSDLKVIKNLVFKYYVYFCLEKFFILGGFVLVIFLIGIVKIIAGFYTVLGFKEVRGGSGEGMI